MSIESTRVYLRKKRIAKKVLLETYAAMQARFGARVSDEEDDDYEEADEDVFLFADFEIGLERSSAGLALVFDGNKFRDAPDEVLDAAEDCLETWANLLGGQIDERELWDRAGAKRDTKASAVKLPVYGPADSLVWLAFDAEGKERGRKIVDNAIAFAGPWTEWAKPPSMCQPAQVLANKIVRVERLSYDVGGKLENRLTFEADESGTLREVARE